MRLSLINSVNDFRSINKGFSLPYIPTLSHVQRQRHCCIDEMWAVTCCWSFSCRQRKRPHISQEASFDGWGNLLRFFNEKAIQAAGIALVEVASGVLWSIWKGGREDLCAQKYKSNKQSLVSIKLLNVFEQDYPKVDSIDEFFFNV